MDKRSLAPLIFVPIGVYLLVMLLVSVLATHPSTLGWIGFAIAAAIAVAAGATALVLFPRSRTNSARAHPHPGPLFRLLVVSDVDVEPAELCSAVKLRLVGRRAVVRVISPVLPSTSHFFADDEKAERFKAHQRLQTALRALAATGIEARGAVGTDDPFQSVGDALAFFPADEILLVGAVEPARGWLDERFEARARDLFDVPVATVLGPAPLARH
jgi:hypothetical protein